MPIKSLNLTKHEAGKSLELLVRPVKPQPDSRFEIDGNGRIPGQIATWTAKRGFSDEMGLRFQANSPFGTPGTILVCRETYVLENSDRVPAGKRYLEWDSERDGEVEGDCWEYGRYLFPHYKADGYDPHIVTEAQFDSMDDRTRWLSPVTMPHWASRQSYEVLGVECKRIRDVFTQWDEQTLRDAGLTVPPTVLFPNENAGSKLMVQAERYITKTYGEDAWESNLWFWFCRVKELTK